VQGSENLIIFYQPQGKGKENNTGKELETRKRHKAADKCPGLHNHGPVQDINENSGKQGKESGKEPVNKRVIAGIGKVHNDGNEIQQYRYNDNGVVFFHVTGTVLN
jgi:hypothetical protein